MRIFHREKNFAHQMLFHGNRLLKYQKNEHQTSFFIGGQKNLSSLPLLKLVEYKKFKYSLKTSHLPILSCSDEIYIHIFLDEKYFKICAYFILNTTKKKQNIYHIASITLEYINLTNIIHEPWTVVYLKRRTSFINGYTC